MGILYKLGIEFMPHLRPYGMDGDTLYLQNTANEEPLIVEGIDTLVLTTGSRSDDTLERALEGYEGEMHLIGDCLAPRTVKEATWDALKVGAAL